MINVYEHLSENILSCVIIKRYLAAGSTFIRIYLKKQDVSHPFSLTCHLVCIFVCDKLHSQLLYQRTVCISSQVAASMCLCLAEKDTKRFKGHTQKRTLRFWSTDNKFASTYNTHTQSLRFITCKHTHKMYQYKKNCL